MVSRSRRVPAAGPFTAALLTIAFVACAPAGDRTAHVDVVASLPPTAGARAQARVAAARPLLRTGSEVQLHERFGVPTFLWASPQGSAAGLAGLRPGPAAGASAGSGDQAIAAARAHLGIYASLYALDAADVDGAVASHVHDLGRGPIVVQFRQAIDGVEVFRERASVVMDRQLRLVAIGGFISGAGAQAFAPAAPAALGAAEAAAAALSDLTGRAVDAGALTSLGPAEGGYEQLRLAADPGAEPIRARRTWFHGPAGLVPGWYVEVDAAPAGAPELFAHVVAASDGTILFKASLTADQAMSNVYTYRVWAAPPNDPANPAMPFDGPQGNGYDPHPTGLPDGTQLAGAAPQLDVSLASSPFCADPWLPLGATETTGNNVEAFANLVTPDGFTPASADFHADVTGPNAFLRTYDPTQPNTVEQEKAAVVQMFYNVNYLHDWFYASGFTEAAGNAQNDNYGRGGLGADSIKAQGEDFSGRNNANMSTPADGGRPRMRMYLFDGIAERHLYLTGAPSADMATGVPSGWGIASHDVTGTLVWVTDGVGSATYPPAATTTKTIHDGCDYAGSGDPNWAPVAGKIAFIDRGGAATAPATTCGFSDKALNAQRAGAIAVIIASTTPHGAASAINMGAATTPPPIITIPAYQLSTPDGDALRTALGSGPVTGRLLRAAAVDRDGTVDNQIMVHEWGHYISNRLVANSSGLTTNLARGLGEGWADFHAMLLTVKEEDVLVASNAGYNGVYAMAVWTSAGGPNGPTGNQGVYFGIRRMPYSTDLARNNQTYKNIQDSSAVPVGVPFAFWPAPNTTAAGGGNSEVHNTGEIWATMLWECYAGLLGDTLGASPRLTFAQARDRMKDYLVAAYQVTPPQPTLLEARDALLAAAYAGGDLQDYHRFLTAFAKRGAGYGALSPDRYTATNNGVTESFITGADLVFRGAAIADDVTSCDRDGILDSGETGTLSVTLRNDSTSQLVATTATVTAIGPNAANVAFPAGTTITFGATNPGESSTGALRISLAAGLTGPQPIDLQVTYGDPALAVPDTTATWSRPGNVDDVLGQAQVDDVESSQPQFTSVTLGNVANLTTWVREELSAYQHAYAVADQNGLTDLALVSPNLSPGTASLVLSFRHRYAFEFSGSTLFDGGVVELSTDFGNTWTDIGGLAAGQAYTGALSGGSTLGTRRAFAGFSPGYPATWVTSTINLGTAYAGQTVRVRFRVASDSNGRANGWEIDDIAFTGLVNRPFPALIANKCTAGVANRRPTASIAAVAATPERTLLTLTGSGTDADGDPLSYQWTQLSGTPVVLSNPTSATPSFTTPDVPAAGGTVVVGLLVFDGTAWSTTVSRTVNITNVDRPPSADAGAPQTVTERTLVTLSGAGSDPDGDLVGYAWTQTAGPAVTLLGSASPTVTFLAPEVTAGGASLAFQLAVTANGVTTSATTSVQVTNVNQPPVASAGPAQLVDERTVVQLAGSGSDPDGDAVTHAWTQVSPASPAVTLSDATAAAPTFTAPEVTADTAFTFQLVVSDGALPSAPSQVTVVVRNVDRPPSADAGAPQTAPERTTVQLSGTGSDPDGQALAFLWVQTGGPAVALSDATAAAPTFTAPDVDPAGATLTFLLTVSAGGATATSSTTVAVTDVNRTPVAVILAPSVALEGTTITLTGSASFDPDGVLASYLWTVDGPLPAGAALRNADQAVASLDTGAVAADTEVTIHLVVGDGLATSAQASFTITVVDLNHAPVAVAGDDLTVAPGALVTLSASASTDADGQALGFSWRQVSGPSVTLTGATTASPTFTAPAVEGSTLLGFEVTVTDGRGGSATSRQSVLVVPPPRPSSGGCSTGDAGSLSLLALLGLALRRRRPAGGGRPEA